MYYEKGYEIMAFQREYMELAIKLAEKGEGAVNPNPLVGAVIVKDNRVIGKGYHARYGELHAERAAIADLSEPADGAEMYVTLEPCCHYGKQPPCVCAIVENKISCVYVGSDDPNEKVAGKGIQYLTDHGVEVHTHMLKKECDELNPVFFHYITKKTPYVMLKYAMTMDGKIAAYTGESRWISNEASRKRVHEMRNRYMGIMVGVGTVISDNPLLTCRMEGGRNPVRIVCDTRLRIPIESRLVQTADEVKTIVAYGASTDDAIREKAGRLAGFGVTLIETKIEDGHIDLRELMSRLGAMKIDGVMIEGGGSLNYSAVMSGIVNEVDIFLAPKILGGESALTPVEGRGFETPDIARMFVPAGIEQMDDDIYIRYIAR